jgi:ADP-heptose:LPS heptosyltransferase
MGDTLWGTPAIRAVKKEFPKAEIDLLVQPQWKPLFHNNKNIRRLISYYPQWYFQIKSLSKIITTRYDHVLIFHANKDIRRILPFLRSKSILSHQSTHGHLPIWNQFFPRKILGGFKNKIIKFEKPVHGILRRLALIEKLQIPTDGTHMEIFFSEEDNIRTHEFLRSNGLNRKNYIYMNVGGSFDYKQWPIDKFISLSKIVLENTSLFIILGGGPEDINRAKLIKKDLSTERIILATQLELKINCGLIKQSKILISPDSGPMHIGFALKVPTVAMFWLINTNKVTRNEFNGPDYCGPLNIKSELYSIISGSFIDIKQAKELGNLYSNSITVEIVWDKVKQHL